MNKILKYIADHVITAIIVGSLFLILIGIGLIIRPAIVVEFFRYLLSALNLLLGIWLLISTSVRLMKKNRNDK